MITEEKQQIKYEMLKEKYPEHNIVRRANGTIRIYKKDHGESLTEQSYKDECDIKNIIKSIDKNDLIKIKNAMDGVPDGVLDLTAPDFMEAMNIVAGAQQAFERFPSDIRDRFRNDPHELLKAIDDPLKHEELRQLGIMAPVQTSQEPEPAPEPEPEPEPTPPSE